MHRVLLSHEKPEQTAEPEIRKEEKKWQIDIETAMNIKEKTEFMEFCIGFDFFLELQWIFRGEFRDTISTATISDYYCYDEQFNLKKGEK